MKNRWFVTPLIIYCCLSASFSHAKTGDPAVAWEESKDLAVNLCNGMMVTDTGGSSVGRLMSAAANAGASVVETPDDEWYYDENGKLVKPEAEMPDNLNHELEGIILTDDYGALSFAREKAWETMSAVSPSSYGYVENKVVKKLLEAKIYPLTPEEMIGFTRVRSIQIDGRDGIFSYPYFNCRFRKIDGKVFFEKTTGSQRKSGYLYQNTPKSLIFLGGWSVNDDPQTTYGSANSVAGMVYRIGDRKAIMIFPSGDNRVEIYEFMK